jgi:LacI family transcriptional regulator
VRAAAIALGYRPNALARSFRSQRTHTIGLISDEIATTPFAGAMIRGAQEAAWKSGHVLMLIDTEGDSDVERAAIEAMLERKVDGLVYARMHHQLVDVPSAVANVPTVLLDARQPDASIPSVVPDEVGGARSAVEHLLRAGHTRIGFVQCIDPIPAAEQRLEGFKIELEAAGIEFGDSLIVCDPLEPGAYAPEVEQLLTTSDRPTALFCFNDRMALGVYNTARRLGLSIPDDLSVVGFDNLETVAPWLDPGLTTIQLPHYEMGRWAVEHLERLIQGESVDPIQFLMPCPLVERGSVKAPAIES